MLGRRLFCAPEGRGKGRANAICIMPAREGECKGEGNLHKSVELRALECRRKAEGVGIKLPPLHSTRGALEHPHCVYAACIDEVPVVECLAGEATKSGE